MSHIYLSQSENDEEFAESVSGLSAGVASQLLEIWTRVSSRIFLIVYTVKPNQDPNLSIVACRILQEIMPLLLALFADKDDQVSSLMAEFFNDYISVVSTFS